MYPYFNYAKETIMVKNNCEVVKSMTAAEITELFDTFSRANRCGVLMTIEDRLKLVEYQRLGFIKFASHTQIEWTVNGTKVIEEYLNYKARA